MTVLSVRWPLARPQRPASAASPRRRTRVLHLLGPARGRKPRRGRPYSDPFFADPAAVEDDYRRMRRGCE
jgi:hypothetical protein